MRTCQTSPACSQQPTHPRYPPRASITRGIPNHSTARVIGIPLITATVTSMRLLIVALLLLPHLVAHAAAAVTIGAAPPPLLPIVLVHGMGDHATAEGMQRLNAVLAEHVNHSRPILNLALGNGGVEDMLASFFLTMNEQTDALIRVVQSNPLLSNGFHAITLSQGSLLLRAYIQQCNSPPVSRWISMHGPLMGVAGLPGCEATDREVCARLDGLVALGAATAFVQQRLAQANYYRDPLRLEAYRAHNIYLPFLNHEEEEEKEEEDTEERRRESERLMAGAGLRKGAAVRSETDGGEIVSSFSSFTSSFSSSSPSSSPSSPATRSSSNTGTSSSTGPTTTAHSRPSYPLSLSATLEALILVKAEADTEVFPNESEWFGYFADGSLDTILPMRATSFYLDEKDALGLRALDEAGKIFLESTLGDHLRFTDAFLLGLVDRYITAPEGERAGVGDGGAADEAERHVVAAAVAR